MIKINLATRKSAVGVGAPSEGKQALQSALGSLGDLELRPLVLPVLVTLLAMWVLDDYKSSELARERARIEDLAAKQAEIRATLAKSAEFERQKAQLEADEFVMQTKIDVIRKLVDGREDSFRILRSISEAIPEQVWLARFRLEGENVELSGGALGFNQISDFMNRLGESAYFANLVLKSTENQKDTSGLNVANFSLGAKRR